MGKIEESHLGGSSHKSETNQTLLSKETRKKRTTGRPTPRSQGPRSPQEGTNFSKILKLLGPHERSSTTGESKGSQGGGATKGGFDFFVLPVGGIN